MHERHDHTQMTDAELLDESLRLSEQRAQTYLTPERRAQISQKLEHCVFEVLQRQQEAEAAKTPATPVN